jgi:phenylacetic acid degradation operon negative regulatory protein
VELTARTLILDLLTTVRRGAMPVRALVEAGGLFGFAENNVRVSLSKLFAEGRATRDERGRYRLAPAAAALSKELRNWRRLEDRLRVWRGDWVAVQGLRSGRGAGRRRHERALAVLGLRPLEPGLDVRPDNLRGGVPEFRRNFAALAGDGVPASIVYGVHGFDPASDQRARNLWNVDALVADYRESTERLAASCARLQHLDTEAAMVETFVVGAEVVRQLQLDPLLPDAILDPSARHALIAVMLEYDELGRSLWAGFLNRHGVPNFGSHRGWRASLGEFPNATLMEMQREH